MTPGSSQVLVKVCGVSHPDDLEAAEGADVIGIVVDVPGSIRSRSEEEARTLVRLSEGRWRTTGVVVDPSLSLVRRLWSEVGVDWVQIHGRVPAGLSPTDKARVLRSVGVAPPGERPPAAAPVPPDASTYAFLHLDTSGGPLPGGTGKVSDWSACRRLVETLPGVPIMLGGGLTPHNVEQALEQVHPRAVDVSSGVEDRPGHKSKAKVRNFLEKVHEWEGAHA